MSSPPNFTNLCNVIAKECGGEILYATDDWFAVAENLLKTLEPEWREGVFTNAGKWMDGWETRRKRIPGHDWAIIKLAFPSVVRGIDADTAFFTGNYVPRISIQAARLIITDHAKFPERRSLLGNASSESETIDMAKLETEKWKEILPMVNLRPGYEDTRHNYFSIDNNETWTHIRLNYYPDGGLARLRVYGAVTPDMTMISNKEMINLLGMEYGAQCLAFSNAHYGHPRNLIKLRKSECMSDGWETSRQSERPPILKYIDEKPQKLNFIGNEWCVFKLGVPGTVNHVECDTSHFKGNSPYSIEVLGSTDMNENKWETILSAETIRPNHIQNFAKIRTKGPFQYVKLIMVPDGGISRFRIWGTYEEI